MNTICRKAVTSFIVNDVITDDAVPRYNDHYDFEIGDSESFLEPLKVVNVPSLPRPRTVRPREKYARFSTDSEFFKGLHVVDIRSTDKIEVGGHVLYSDYRKAMIDSSDNHSIIFGASGARKTTLQLITTLFCIARSGENAFVSDPKGEIFDYTYGMFSRNGYRVVRINLRDMMNSWKMNPIAIIYKWYFSEDASLRTKAENMMGDFVAGVIPEEKGNDPYWYIAAASVILGSLYLLYNNCGDPEKINLRSLADLIRRVSEQDVMVQRYIRGLSIDNPIRVSLESVIDLPDTTRHCVTSIAIQALSNYTTQDLVACVLGKDEIELDTFVDVKTVIFITVPDESKTYHPLVSLFIKQAYEILVAKADSRPTHNLPVRVNFILDEFASFPAIKDFDSMISAARSRGIRFLLVLQSMRQLFHAYGVNTAHDILGNCTNLVFFYSREMELLDYIVALGGHMRNGENLLTTSMLQRLDKDRGEAVVFHNRCFPYLSEFVMFKDWACADVSSEAVKPPSSFKIPSVFDFDNDRVDMKESSAKPLTSMDWDFSNPFEQYSEDEGSEETFDIVGILRLVDE